MSNNCLISLHRSVSRSCIRHLQIVVGVSKETIPQTITASCCCYMYNWVMVPVVKNLFLSKNSVLGSQVCEEKRFNLFQRPTFCFHYILFHKQSSSQTHQCEESVEDASSKSFQ